MSFNDFESTATTNTAPDSFDDIWAKTAETVAEGKYWKPDVVGKKAEFLLENVTTKLFDNADAPVPVLHGRTAGGDEIVVTASNRDLKAKLAAARPSRGSMLQITYSGDRELPGERSMKLFEVKHIPAEKVAEMAAAKAQASADATPPAAPTPAPAETPAPTLSIVPTMSGTPPMPGIGSTPPPVARPNVGPVPEQQPQGFGQLVAAQNAM